MEFSINYDDVKVSTEPSPLLVGGYSEIDITPVALTDVEKWLTFHPVIPRGIEIKANRMVSRGYIVSGKNEEAVKYCENILNNSGGIIFLKRWTEDAIAFGNGYGKLVPNKADTEIVYVDIKHPVYFGYLKEKNSNNEWQIVIDSKTNRPKGFSQYRYTSGGEKERFGQVIPLDEVAHLAFDRWGDEIEGTSIMQYLQTTLGNIINIENAGAQAGYLSGNPRYKFTTNIKDRAKLQEFANSVRNINERDAIILTEGSDAEILSPGITNFPEYHERFLTLLAVKLGIPKPLLTMDATCHSEDTEVLTESGFKYYNDITEEDKIAVYDKDTDIIKFEYPKDFMVYDYDGLMYEFDNKVTNCKVTPNHKMLFRTYSKNSEYQTELAKNLNYEYFNFKTNGTIDGTYRETITIPAYSSKMVTCDEEIFKMDEFLELLGWYMSEGWTWYGRTFISQNVGPKADKIRQLLQKMNFDFSEYEDTRDRNVPTIKFTIHHAGLSNWLKQFGTKSYKKELPQFIKDLPKEQIEIFLESFIAGDGNISKNGHISMYSSSKKLIDDLQYLVFKCGKKTKIKKYEDNRYNGFKTMYRLSTHKNSKKETLLHKSEHLEIVNYTGKVFCFETSTGFFVTRRNGKIAIQGNSTNKATLQQQLQFLSEENKADEEVIKQTIEKQIFEVACKKKFGENFDSENVPKFHFKNFGTEEETFINNSKTKAETIKSLIESAVMLNNMNRQDISEKIFKYINFMVGKEHDIHEGTGEENRTISEGDKQSEDQTGSKDENTGQTSGTPI